MKFYILGLDIFYARRRYDLAVMGSLLRDSPIMVNRLRAYWDSLQMGVQSHLFGVWIPLRSSKPDKLRLSGAGPIQLFRNGEVRREVLYLHSKLQISLNYHHVW